MVVQFIDKYRTCSLTDKYAYSELYDLVRNVQSPHDTATCCKEKGFTFRFDTPWSPPSKTLIFTGIEDQDKVNKSKKVIDNVLSKGAKIDDLSNLSKGQLLKISG